ncbi:MAG: zinc ribbon domain-containing protein [Conexivisphaerales archaeon]
MQEGAEVQRQKAKGMERCDKSIQLLPTKTWKRTTAQAIQNASLNRFTQTLSYKAESAGMIVKVDARNTSKECSIQEIPLLERIYICKRCGLQKDRDVNAAINMLKSRTCPNLRSGRYICQCVPTGNASSVEELKTLHRGSPYRLDITIAFIAS